MRVGSLFRMGRPTDHAGHPMTAPAALSGREVAAPLILVDVHLLWQADPDPADLVVRDRWGEIVGDA